MRLSWIVLGCASLCSAAFAQQALRQPDVFLITIDTLRADHVHCYGYAQIETPALDSIAGDGIRFEQAFTPSPLTNTSHTSILTGLLPSSHGVVDFGIPLASTYSTAAEMFRARGYRTAAFIGAIILDSKSLAPGLDRGFDFYDNFPSDGDPKARWGRVERRAEDVVHHAEQWLISHPRGPYFVWVHLYDPHDPYEPPAPYSKLYADRLYDGEIAYADSALAKFIGFLKRRSDYQNALIAVVGDHGEGLGQHGEDTHGIFLYDSTTHVPLLLKLRGGKAAGKVVRAQVRTTDLLPTLLDYSGAGTTGSSDLKFDGGSLRSLIDGTEASGRAAIGETDYPLRFGWAPLRSVRTDARKFIEAPKAELYDLATDPNELRNLYDTKANVARFREMLSAAQKPAPQSIPQSNRVGNGARSELSALGYVGSEQSRQAPSAAAGEHLPDPKDHIEEQNLLHRAMLAAESNQPAIATEALQKTLALDPKSLLALRQLGELEMKAGDWQQAAQHFKAAHDLKPDDATVSLQLGKALSKLSDFAGARDALEAGLKANPSSLSDRVLLGMVYLALKDGCAATDQFEAALLLEPQNAEARAGLQRVQAQSPCQR